MRLRPRRRFDRRFEPPEHEQCFELLISFLKAETVMQTFRAMRKWYGERAQPVKLGMSRMIVENVTVTSGEPGACGGPFPMTIS